MTALLMSYSAVAQNFRVAGTVLEQGSADAVAGALVFVEGGESSAETGAEGTFEIDIDAQAGRLTVRLDGYVDKSVRIGVPKAGRFDAGTIFLAPDALPDAPDLDRAFTQATQSDDVDFASASTVSSLLVGSRDPFQQAAAFNFNATRFRIRGYDNRYTEVFLNGAPVNDPEAGRPFFYLWGGLNDVTRNRYNTIDLGFQPFDASALGGIGNLDLRAGSQRAVTRASLAASNRSWRYRGMATHNTGWTDSGWALSVSASARFADEGYIPGTYQQAFGYFVGVDKTFGAGSATPGQGVHRVSATVFASPSLRGGASSAIQEVYDLAGTNYFNRNWGYQAGQVRNSREYRTHQPIAVLTHEWSPSPRTNWQTTITGQTGRNGQTRLERNEAPNPLGTYYQYLPSFSTNPETRAEVEAAIRADPEFLQIDWDQLYAVNRQSFGVVEDADGIAGNDVAGAQARYWLEEQRYDPNRVTLASRLRREFGERFTLHGGVIGLYSSTENYKVVDDLLGSDFVLNVNPFAQRDLGSAEAAQDDVDTPNRLARTGDRFGYDYDSRVSRAQAFAQVVYVGRRFDVFGGLSGEREQQWRVGKVRNGQFPENSFGESPRQTFATGTVRGGVTYKVNGRNYVSANGYYGTKASDFRDAMVSPRTRNEFVADLTPETIASAELSYQYRAPRLKAKVTGYATRFADRMRNIRFFIETIDNNTGFGSYVIQGIDSEHLGVEAAAEYDLNDRLEATVAFAHGRYRYTSRPTANAFVDNSGEKIVDEETIYLRDFFVGQTPQQVASAALRFQGKQYYSVSLTGSYARYAFSDFGPLRRTSDAVRGLEPGSELVREITDLQELPSAFTLDLFANKSWKIGDRFVYLTAAVNNLLDNRSIVSGAREQLRYDFETRDVNRFPNQFYYAFGTNFFVQVAYQF